MARSEPPSYDSSFVRGYLIATLSASHLIGDQPAAVRMTTWYPKPHKAFSSDISLARRSWWHPSHVPLFNAQPEVVYISQSLLVRLPDALCSAPYLDKVKLSAP